MRGGAGPLGGGGGVAIGRAAPNGGGGIAVFCCCGANGEFMAGTGVLRLAGAGFDTIGVSFQLTHSAFDFGGGGAVDDGVVLRGGPPY